MCSIAHLRQPNNKHNYLFSKKTVSWTNCPETVCHSTPLPSPLMGEKPILNQIKYLLENSRTPSHRKGFNTIPSPLGEGQTVPPKIRHNQGEVPSETVVHLTLSRLPLRYASGTMSHKGEKPMFTQYPTTFWKLNNPITQKRTQQIAISFRRGANRLAD